MADFNIVFDKTMKNEGGYANRPNDFGGETYKGISRRYNPHWIGWQTIDRHKKNPLFPSILDREESLQIDVRSFYRQNHWDTLLLDEIQSDLIAYTLFDISVSMGEFRAVIFLQKALNVLNRRATAYPDIVEDGKFGPVTFGTLRRYLDNHRDSYLVQVMNDQRSCHYMEFARKSETQEDNFRGWLNRVANLT